MPRLVDAFSLVPDGGFLARADQIFCDFRHGGAVVGMDWDNWMEFMVVAKTPAAESLVREIGSWLNLNMAARLRDNPHCNGPAGRNGTCKSNAARRPAGR